MSEERQNSLGLALPLLGPALVLALWWAVGLFAPPDAFWGQFLPRPTFTALQRLVGSEALWLDIFASLRRIAIGLSLSILIGFPLGAALGVHRNLNRASGPVMHFVRMVSPLSWTPLAIMALGIGDRPVVFLITIASLWPIALSVSASIAALDGQLSAVGRTLGGTRFEIARHIIWPSIRGQVLTGVRVSIGLAWVVLVPAEMLGVDSGLGFFILGARDRLAYSELVAALLVIGALGMTLDALARHFLTPRIPDRRKRNAAALVSDATAESA